MTKRRVRKISRGNGHPTLVGNTGIVYRDNRLYPLRMNRKYKDFLEAVARERKSKISQMLRFTEQYWGLCDLLYSLNRANENNSNSALIKELEENKLKVRKKLLYLKSKLDVPLPKDLKESMYKIFNQSANRQRRRTWSHFATKRRKRSILNPDCKKTAGIQNSCEKKKSSKEVVTSCPAALKYQEASLNNRQNYRSSWSGSVKSQIFVKINNLTRLTISIDLFSTGSNLVHVLTNELGEDSNKYNLMFGTREVDMNKTLFEQEIYHGTTVDLNARLHGGVGKNRKSQKKKKAIKLKYSGTVVAATQEPELWNEQEVTEWLLTICQKFDIDEEDISLLKGYSGQALDSLEKEDWIDRSPGSGTVIFKQWQKLKETHSVNKEEEENKVDLKSADIGESFKVQPSSLPPKSDKEHYESTTTGNDVQFERNVNEKSSTSTTNSVSMFGEVPSLDTIGTPMNLQDLSDDGIAPTPEFGSVVTVAGICTEAQSHFDNTATLFIRDEPQGASSVFHKMKVVICSNKASVNLQPYNVERLLKGIKIDTHVAVKGRVERLDKEDCNVEESHCEMIRFKLVVDSDDHALVYVKRERPKFTRQLSQPWWIQLGASETSFNQCELKVGDRIVKTTQRVFCESSVSDDEIMNCVLAFKNCCDGEIFVGVEKNGLITGRDFDEGQVAKWREKLAMSIASILPTSDAAICSSVEEATNLVFEKKTFVCIIHLSKPSKSQVGHKCICWIHVTKGETAPFYFRKQSDVHSFIRKGAETKLITSYEELFSSLSSLAFRPKPREISDEELNSESKFSEAMGKTGLQKNYEVLKEVRCESHDNEMKMIFGANPTKTIVDSYLTKYTCGFLNAENASGGTILFGVQEEEKSKCGHIVGITVPLKERRELVDKAVAIFSKFYPPVRKGQFRLIFHQVTVPKSYIVKNKQPNEDGSDAFVFLCGPSEEVGKKWPKFVKDRLNDCLCRVIPVEPERFCIVVKSQEDIPEEFAKYLTGFLKQNPKITRKSITESELKPILKNLCMIELKLSPSQYPIHVIKPIDTYVFNKKGEIVKLTMEKMMRKFDLDVQSPPSFDVDKFLGHVEHFQQSGNSYILITSPFELPKTERDLYGLVLPQWTLAIDFDQQLKDEGHLFHRFKELNDIHQLERERFIKTPQDTKLDLNPEKAICWLAARGYVEIAKSLSEEGHGNWNMTHREPLRTLLKAELTSCVKPNYLNIVVLWDDHDDQESALVDSLRTVLEDILSINGHRTAVTFVCSTPEVRVEINEKLVRPLQKTYWERITTDRVYVAPPYVLSRHLSFKLPAPHQAEDDFQVPHKKEYRGKDQVFPDILPRQLRQNISRYLKMMYMKKERIDEKRRLEDEGRKFYSGSKITYLGLQQKFGIEREKMDELEKEFKALSNDKRSHVSMLCLKVDRGAGSSTLCLQFLYKHHKKYPCAELLEIGEKLLSYIKDINNATKLPLVLFVDEEISHPQDFLDFTKELVECRTVNVILLLIEPAEVGARKVSTPHKTMNSTRMKSATDSSTLRTCPNKVVELRRQLSEKEFTNLARELIKIKKDKKTSEKLEKQKNKAKQDKTVRTFAHFGLTAFGKDFSGLVEFVRFRLKIANDKQKTVLSFLSLIHVFTDSHLPASALARFLEANKTVNLEEEFQNDYLRELLSPPLDDKDSQRISFHEVAEEILFQLASAKSGGGDKTQYWQFIKDVSVDLAKHVLSVYISTKSIDRLTRRLFVTSEFESEKFSSLIRAMKDDHSDIARDTLTELVQVFEKHSSFSAHIRAHLAKYYMIVEKKFEKAKPLIEQAIKDQQDDALLRHIHGDIIRLHVQSLKKNPDNVDMDAIVTHAIESCDSFQFVRRKRPNDSHGYMSDAMVRITVMQAAIKKQTEKLEDDQNAEVSFVDYLVERIDEFRKTGERRIPEQEKYLLSLIPDAYQFLYEGVGDEYEHKEKWKEHFSTCIGELSNLRKLCLKIREQADIFSFSSKENSTWLHEVVVSIQSLNNRFEIDRENLTPEQIQERIQEIEACALGLKCPEPLMKFWIRYSRFQKNVPHLNEVKKRIKDWVVNTKRQNRTSPSAEFYNYVVNVLIALQDPNDREKRKKVEKLLLGKKSKKDSVVVPQEWLHPKDGHHINSIDSLFHHDDLVKDKNGTPRRGKQQPGREVIEGYLREKQIRKWKGTVTDIQKLWLGTITFKKHFEVRFIPQSVQTSMPKEGDTVSFCLGIDRLGLSAWWVRHEVGDGPLDAVKTYSGSDGDESSSDEEENVNGENTTSTSLFDSNFVDQRDNTWESRNSERLQGVVTSTNPTRGFGHIKHPDINGNLFFHASQLVNPVITLKGTIERPMVLEFKVEKLSDKTRATDIHVVEEEKVQAKIAEYRKLIEQHSSPSTNRRQKETTKPAKLPRDTQSKETGVVVRHYKDKTYGFIKPDSESFGQDVFFHVEHLVDKGPIPSLGQRVQFYALKTEKGFAANDVSVCTGTSEKPMVQEFKENLQDKTRATDIVVVEAERVQPRTAEHCKLSEQNSSSWTRQKEPSKPTKSPGDTQPKRETGVVVRHYKDKTYGFIKPDSEAIGQDVFFHIQSLVDKGPIPNVRQRVQFYVLITEKGFVAKDVSVCTDDT